MSLAMRARAFSIARWRSYDGGQRNQHIGRFHETTHQLLIPHISQYKVEVRIRAKIKQTLLLVHYIIHSRNFVSGSEKTLAQNRTQIASTASDEDTQIHGLFSRNSKNAELFFKRRSVL